MSIIKVPTRDDFRADVARMAQAITPNTVMIAGSTPQYPQGVIDDIPGLADVAREAGVWMHVDACVGGFLLPFMRRLDRLEREFDFSVPGVWSVSADLHKFGHCPNGISSLTLYDSRLYAYQRYELQGGSSGSYATGGLLGSRPGGILAAAWAAMMTLGEDGYTDIATAIVRNGAAIAEGVNAIPGLSLLCPSEAGIVVISGSHEVPIPALVDAMRRRRPAYWTSEPPALHVLLDPVNPDVVDRYLVDLRAAADDVRRGSVTSPQGGPVYVKD
jgi:glutamate/tyrosine decarboxylase-like PLP-dependent enzyme